ncbi:DUF3472 domain-containing protein [Gramella jeungdoensis]|uniref:DUF3472 domain-containing protein n=1 Tax=Gramella jeungdoensis TaxID=708091 RepID=A0ABT0Z4L8_9FLAO|nr:DUF3472 domain-containing protein [Gramella jeungdoensis]MCM8570358.1 DUF3472 domain-containing protein [Gramella jeungdoensis]
MTLSKLKLIPFCFLSGFILLISCSADATYFQTNKKGSEELVLNISIPPGGNTWVVNDISANSTLISEEGVKNWENSDHLLRTYFKVNQSGSLHVGLEIKVPKGQSRIKVTLGDESKEISVNNTDYEVIPVGIFNLSSSGYHNIQIQGLEKESNIFGEIKNFVVGGNATSSGLTMVDDDFYWGRRGPSVHLSYDIPTEKDIQWYYNEVTVPEGQDKIGSYFMSNGFAEGYFGMQVNSASERRILFSVWSPYETQNPDDIPEDYKIILLGNGENVHVGEFGNEGSGGQSYLRYDWKAGNTYKFLLKGEPSENNSTDYTAYFYAPETGEWQLIASFRRPYTSTYLTNFHSFLENFSTEHGFEERKALYENQWVRDIDGNWIEATKAKFTADATARSGNRLDYAGGQEENRFFLKNGGFFSNNTLIDSEFERSPNSEAPSIDFSLLETPLVQISVEEPSEDFFDKTEWEVIDFSSEAIQGEGDNGLASLILDSNAGTYWHSCWSGCHSEQTYPHFLTIDLKSTYEVNGIVFQQRNGSRKIQDLEILYSDDGENWYSLGNYILENSSSTQSFNLPEPVSMNYLKLIANSSYDGQEFAALAEVSLF